jgi:hypothetical protein
MPTDPLLFELALSASNHSEAIFLADLAHPVWSGRNTEWGQFVPCGVRERWAELSMDVKLAVYVTASVAFDRATSRDI